MEIFSSVVKGSSKVQTVLQSFLGSKTAKRTPLSHNLLLWSLKDVTCHLLVANLENQKKVEELVGRDIGVLGSLGGLSVVCSRELRIETVTTWKLAANF